MNNASAISNRILQAAIEAHASDIHFIPQTSDIQIFFRCNGKRNFHTSLTKKQYMMIISYYKFTGKMDIGENRTPQQGTIHYQYQNQTYSLRLSTLPANNLESLAIRLLPQQNTHSLHQLFLFPQQLQIIQSWLYFQSGLVLLTGATGSGKTTTLYAIIKAFMETNHYQTITLEDPIEKPLDNVLQVQINEKAGMTYDVGLKAALRHDPDIIMVGEIRDQTTAKFAFRASNTGHLVLSTLHANSAQGTIHRLLEMGIKPIDIEHNLMAVASMQLLSLDLSKLANRRAAILEILELQHIRQILQEKPCVESFRFDHLRRKAYAYGFIKNL
ncbi:competence-related pilin export protein ComGA [Gracilibacillus orientalis]|uniref:Competence-related pilin export protein ComGA n=1 Tax=Gracilibacillus orientalis TaxID=334253 RepID=A0A1I4KUK1_9BACI|nr:competence type IV pilus ATPase ComGA [Gracilibacillus orientalis]SFL82482.1 competence-related pilin export protein ComGA [Gracilibacillus orientalis]